MKNKPSFLTYTLILVATTSLHCQENVNPLCILADTARVLLWLDEVGLPAKAASEKAEAPAVAKDRTKKGKVKKIAQNPHVVRNLRRMIPKKSDSQEERA
jgi:hypothetical protein